MISQLSISQNSYPKEVKLGNDTVVCITFPQLKEIIYEIELSEGKTQVIDSMEVALGICDTSLSYYQSVVNNLENQNSNLTNQIDKHKKINHLLVQENIGLTKKVKRHRFWTKVGSIASGVIITVLTVVIAAN